MLQLKVFSISVILVIIIIIIIATFIIGLIHEVAPRSLTIIIIKINVCLFIVLYHAVHTTHVTAFFSSKGGQGSSPLHSNVTKKS